MVRSTVTRNDPVFKQRLKMISDRKGSKRKNVKVFCCYRRESNWLDVEYARRVKRS